MAGDETIESNSFKIHQRETCVRTSEEILLWHYGAIVLNDELLSGKMCRRRALDMSLQSYADLEHTILTYIFEQLGE